MQTSPMHGTLRMRGNRQAPSTYVDIWQKPAEFPLTSSPLSAFPSLSCRLSNKRQLASPKRPEERESSRQNDTPVCSQTQRERADRKNKRSTEEERNNVPCDSNEGRGGKAPPEIFLQPGE